ncbi:HAD family hydrolase [Thiovibrio sp. JS02]
MKTLHYLFDWGNTLMAVLPGYAGPMCDWPEVAAMPEAVPTLQRLSRVVPCHLATNAGDSDEARIRAALARVGLDRYISNIYCLGKTGSPKPEPAFFAFIRNHLRVEPSSLLMVGDSLHDDVLGAQQCGLRAIWYNPGKAPVPEGVMAIDTLGRLVRSPADARP